MKGTKNEGKKDKGLRKEHMNKQKKQQSKGKMIKERNKVDLFIIVSQLYHK